MSKPIVLVDMPDDGLDERGCVSADVDAHAATAALTEINDPSMRLTEPVRVWLRMQEPDRGPDADGQLWVPCDASHDGAREFWQLDVTEEED